MRVHAFLEMWGLINYQVEADKKPNAIGPASTNSYSVLVDMPLGIQSLQPNKALRTTPADSTGHCHIALFN